MIGRLIFGFVSDLPPVRRNGNRIVLQQVTMTIVTMMMVTMMMVTMTVTVTIVMVTIMNVTMVTIVMPKMVTLMAAGGPGDISLTYL